MSLYHEAAAALTAPASDGGNLKTRIFGPRSKDGKDSKDSKEGSKDRRNAIPPAQIYALAAESCKWSVVLSEVIDRAGLLVHERRRLTPTLALLLVHDLLIARAGAGAIQLPEHHGLRAAVERHKARLSAELTRARLRRNAHTLQVLREQVERDAAASVSTSSSLAAATRWVRINTLKTTLEQQLATTFAGYEQVEMLQELFKNLTDGGPPRIYIDEHVPNLVAVPLVTVPSSSSLSPSTDLTRCDAYKRGAIIFQDKASCFPAYLLDPASVPGGGGGGGGHIIDACAAPGNKTSHLAALLHECSSPSLSTSDSDRRRRQVFAFEKDNYRSKTLHNMLLKAGALGDGDGDLSTIDAGQDFLRVDPTAARFRDVRALLLDPSCSGSGIVGRDAMPVLHLPKAVPMTGPPPTSSQQVRGKGKKRKRGAVDIKDAKNKKAEVTAKEAPAADLDIDSDLQTKDDPAARLAALASFQLALLLHAFSFPAARRVTYSTCSVHAQENEQVVVRALRAAARKSASTSTASRWRLLRRDEQVEGMRAWPVRGDPKGAECVDRDEDDEGDEEEEDVAAIAEACIRSYPDDDRGVMGFFVVAFVRDEDGSLDTKNGASAAEAATTTIKRPQQNGKGKKATKKTAPQPAAVKSGDSDGDEWVGFDD